MTELRDMFHQREQQIAFQATAAPGLATRLDSTAMRHRRTRHTRAGAVGIVGIGVATAAAIQWWPGGLVDPVAPEASVSDASPTSESLSPSGEAPAPSLTAALIEGYAQVPQLPAESIPWDEVGPGWFMVEFGSAVVWPNDMSGRMAPIEQVDGGLSLLAPDGTWYAMSTMADLGPGVPLLWDGNTMWLGTAMSQGGEAPGYDFSVIELPSLTVTGTVGSVPIEQATPVGDGLGLTYAWGGEGLINLAVGRGSAGAGACSDAGSDFIGVGRPDMSYLYSGGADGDIVCFGPTDPTVPATMTLVPVRDVAASEVIGELEGGAAEYTFLGWFDDTRFYFARNSPEVDGGGQVFRYDVFTKTATELDLGPLGDRVRADATGVFYDRASSTYVATSYGDTGWVAEIFDEAGDLVRTIDVGCTGVAAANSPSFHASGAAMLIACADPGFVELYDLSTGGLLMRWDVGVAGRLNVFGHPDQ